MRVETLPSAVDADTVLKWLDEAPEAAVLPPLVRTTLRALALRVIELETPILVPKREE